MKQRCCPQVLLAAVIGVTCCLLGSAWSFETRTTTSSTVFFHKTHQRASTVQYATTTPQEEEETNNNNNNNEVVDKEKSSESIRRNLIFGSAAVFSSALLALSVEPNYSQAANAAASTSGLDDAETRRIDIFEKTAPSVVFIDTFTEKQDQFSTNVQDVPLGTGTGFVWDKQGHIGE